jgi:hypothetical protein
MLACMESKNRVEGRARGGVARAQSLTKQERSEIAKKAAIARWAKDIPVATHEGFVRFGNQEVACAVIEHEGEVQRVLTQSGFMRALGRARQAKGRQYYKGDVNLPAFLTAQNLKPFVSKELEVTSSQVEFLTTKGARAFGYSAELLPAACDVFIQAERHGALKPSQKHIAEQAHVILMALANLGMAGLIDEATGYQEVRDKHALQAILAKFLSDKLGVWAKRFPDEFYEHIFRLKGWKWKGRGVNPPQVVAHYTKDIVYNRLTPGLLEELERRNPVEGGRRKNPHTRLLSDDVGIPALTQHLHTVMAFQRVTPDGEWDQFIEMLNVALPRRSDTMQFLKAREPKALPKPTTEDLPLFQNVEGPTAEAAGP